jgi:hypothetical protein
LPWIAPWPRPRRPAVGCDIAEDIEKLGDGERGLGIATDGLRTILRGVFAGA